MIRYVPLVQFFSLVAVDVHRVGLPTITNGAVVADLFNLGVSKTIGDSVGAVRGDGEVASSFGAPSAVTAGGKAAWQDWNNSWCSGC